MRLHGASSSEEVPGVAAGSSTAALVLAAAGAVVTLAATVVGPGAPPIDAELHDGVVSAADPMSATHLRSRRPPRVVQFRDP
jgi:hypothetical protein